MIRYAGFDDLIGRMVDEAPDKAALQCAPIGEEGVRTVTWGEFGNLVRTRADELSAQACACEAILADGAVGCVVEVFAAVQAGLQVVLVDPLMPNDVMMPLLSAVDADCVWASNDARREALE